MGVNVVVHARRVAGSVLRPVTHHRIFAGLFAVAAALRLITILGYRPAQLYWGDSFSYLDLAIHVRPSEGFRPSGYPFLLWFLRPLHSVAAIAAFQHALGLGAGLMIYALLRRRGMGAWGAVLATLPVLLDASFLKIEHEILSDTLFMVLTVAAVTVLIWTARPTAWHTSAAGVLLAMATLTRTVALPLLVVIVVYLAVRRIGWRPVLAFSVAATLPLMAYAGWYKQHHGRFALSGVDGISLWARTMTFADCSVIKPPPDQAPLCPRGTRQDAASEYVWAPDSAVNQMPGGKYAPRTNALARRFAVRAIVAQPMDYLSDVAHDTALTFAWTPMAHPKRIKPAFTFEQGRWTIAGNPKVDEVRHAYDPRAGYLRSEEPYAGFLVRYQHIAYLRGPLLALIFAVGAIGIVRRRRQALLPWSAAVTLLVAPIAVLDFDHRYVLPVIPLACLAAALAAIADPRPGASGRPPPPEHRTPNRTRTLMKAEP